MLPQCKAFAAVCDMIATRIWAKTMTNDGDCEGDDSDGDSGVDEDESDSDSRATTMRTNGNRQYNSILSVCLSSYDVRPYQSHFQFPSINITFILSFSSVTETTMGHTTTDATVRD